MGPIEKEFDPTEFSAEFVAVGHDEAISSILDRVAEVLHRTPNVVLIVPRGSQAFHTTQDFLALGKLQWTGEVRVAVASPDPTIAGLARVLGFHIVDAPPDHPSIAGDPSFDQPEGREGDIEQPTAPLPLGGLPDWVISPSIPVITTPSSSLTTSTWLNMPGDAPALPHTVPPVKRSGMPPPRTKPRQTGVLLPTNIGNAPPLTPVVDPAKVDDPKTEDGDAKARRALIDAKAYRNGRRWRYNSGGRTMRWSRILAAIAVLVVVALIAGSAYAYVYLPEGTISVTPKDQSFRDLRVEISVVTAPAQGSNPQNSTAGTSAGLSGPAINGISIEAPLSEAEMAPATGARQVPRGKAQGSMHFANQTSLSTFVPAGTQFQAPNRVIVQTTKGVNVPPTNLLGGTIGRADAPLVANVEGPDGNLAAGQLTGVYGGNALQYTNSTLTGGTLQTIKLVTQADIDGLVTSLTAKVDSEKSAAIQGIVQPGQQLITQTITLANVQTIPDRKAGEDGETVNVKVTATARAFVYRESYMDSSIEQAVIDWVRTPSNIPASAGPQVWGNIAHDAPLLMSVDSETGRAIYSSNASAAVKFTLTPDMDRQIRELVKGQEIAKAQQLIEQTYGGYLDAQSIQAKVLWFNIGKLPSDPGHIVVQLGSGGSHPPSQQQQSDNSPRPSQR